MRRDDDFSIAIPAPAQRIIEILEKNGFEAYIVGGSVRDALMGVDAEDWDITSSAEPEDVKRLFRRSIETGIEHGTVTVLMQHRTYEVTTFRVDGAYSDGRHPDSVRFTKSLEEDLARRDFTVNAMAYSPERGLIDLFGSREDLEKRLIRAVGDPDERFSEDALRMLRAVRFAARLDFRIEEETARSVQRHAADLAKVSKERVLAELRKLICSAHPEKISLLRELGLSHYICEGFENIDTGYIGELKESSQTASWYEDVTRDPAFDLGSSCDVHQSYIRFALLTEGMAEDTLRKIMRLLKADNHTAKSAGKLSSHVLIPLPSDRYELKKLMNSFEAELFMDLMKLKLISRGTRLYRERCIDEDLDAALKVCLDIIDRAEPVYLRDLAVGGSDLIRAGVQEGPAVGRVLGVLHDRVLRDPSLNVPEILLGMTAELIS